MIEAHDLKKRYGDLLAVDGISFTVNSGEIYGLLGPNGAGKTTTLSMLAGLLKPDQGRILYDGVDLLRHPREVKAKLGIVPQENALYENLSAREHLRFWGGLYGLSGQVLEAAVLKSLDQVSLGGRAKEPIKGFSGGMKRRLNLAMGLVHSPQVVLMDEPTVGIDPQARANILEIVQGVASTGTSVLYTTHYLDEVETICDRIGIMDHGRLLAEGTLEELHRMVGGEEVVTIEGRLGDDFSTDLSSRGWRLISAEQDKVVVATDRSEGESPAVRLLGDLFAEGRNLQGVTIEPPSLNGLFLKLTGREFRD